MEHFLFINAPIDAPSAVLEAHRSGFPQGQGKPTKGFTGEVTPSCAGKAKGLAVGSGAEAGAGRRAPQVQGRAGGVISG